MRPGWEEIIWSIEVMSPGLVSEIFLIDLLDCFSLVIHGLLWDFPSIQATHEGSLLVLMRFLGIIYLLNSLRRYLKLQWFSLWCQTRSSLFSSPMRYSIYHSLDMSSLVSSAPITSLSTSSRLVRILDGLSVGVRIYYPASRLLSWPKIRIFRVCP